MKIIQSILFLIGMVSLGARAQQNDGRGLGVDSVARDSTWNSITQSITDSTSSKRNRQLYHGLSVELLGPAFMSSVGYNLEYEINQRLLLQFDFRAAGHVGYFTRGWSIGPSLNQSVVLFGKNPKLKLGLSEGIVFNVPSINGKFNSWEPWDRPPRMMYYFSANIGCEITVVKGLFYITPEVNFSLLNKMGYTADDNMNIIEITRRYFLPSCGIDFKFRL